MYGLLHDCVGVDNTSCAKPKPLSTNGDDNGGSTCGPLTDGALGVSRGSTGGLVDAPKEGEERCCGARLGLSAASVGGDESMSSVFGLSGFGDVTLAGVFGWFWVDMLVASDRQGTFLS